MGGKCRGAGFTRAGLIRGCAGLAAAALCSAAYAHPGHGGGALAGFFHPLLGLDHLLAMVATGVWATLLERNARWMVPLSFLAVMAAGAALGMAGIALPAAEFGIAASVLLAGLLIGFRVRMGVAAGTSVVALFAVFHGYAHGVEMPALAAPWQYGAGFIVATGLLQGAGILLGCAVRTSKAGTPALGILLGASGGWMLAALAR